MGLLLIERAFGGKSYKESFEVFRGFAGQS
jgi:hypothetical protein